MRGAVPQPLARARRRRLRPPSTRRCNIHAADRAAAEDTHPVDHAFEARATLDDDFELIPIPGHTPGATAFLWDSGEHRMLFTGDSLYLRDGEWIVAVLEDSDRESYIESLGADRRARLRRPGPLGSEQGRPVLGAHRPRRHAPADRRDPRAPSPRREPLRNIKGQSLYARQGGGIAG